MRFLFSGYSNYIKQYEVNNNFNVKIINELQLNSSSFITMGEYVFAYDRVINPNLYLISIKDLKILDTIKIKSETLTHLTYAKKRNILFGCSYNGGTFFAIKIIKDKFGKLISFTREEEYSILSRCHCVLINDNEDTLVVVNIATDKVNIYQIYNDHLEYRKSIQLPVGVGPRHCIYSQNENLLYLVTEYSNEIFVVDIKKESILQRISTLKDFTVESNGATLCFSKDYKYLYASNRGEDTIVKFTVNNDGTISKIDSFNVYGKHSRHMIISKDNKYIISCNKDSNNICFINLNKYNLELEIAFDNPSCVIEVE